MREAYIETGEVDKHFPPRKLEISSIFQALAQLTAVAQPAPDHMNHLRRKAHQQGTEFKGCHFCHHDKPIMIKQ